MNELVGDGGIFPSWQALRVTHGALATRPAFFFEKAGGLASITMRTRAITKL